MIADLLRAVVTWHSSPLRGSSEINAVRVDGPGGIARIRRRRAAGAIAAAVALVLDQLSKGLVFANVGLGEELAISPLLSVLVGWNEGAAFGIARGMAAWLLVATALAITTGLAVLLLKTHSGVQAVGLGAVIGGAVGNIADRIRFGAVRDFIDVHWNTLRWPTFNAADMFVVAGLALFIVADLRRQRIGSGHWELTQ